MKPNDLDKVRARAYRATTPRPDFVLLQEIAREDVARLCDELDELRAQLTTASAEVGALRSGLAEACDEWEAALECMGLSGALETDLDEALQHGDRIDALRKLAKGAVDA